MLKHRWSLSSVEGEDGGLEPEGGGSHINEGSGSGKNLRPNWAGDRETETDEEQVGWTGGARRQSWSLRQLQAGEEPEPEPPSK